MNALLRSEATAGHVWVWDKPLYVAFDGGCCTSRRRMDLWSVIGNVVVAIEIDEDQHRSHNPCQDLARYSDLVMDFTGRFVFLRINPDSYKTAGVRVNPSFQERLPVVEEKLRELLQAVDRPTDQLVEVHHLFYDQHTLTGELTSSGLE